MCSRRRRSCHEAVAVATRPGTTFDRGLDHGDPTVACSSPWQPLQGTQTDSVGSDISSTVHGGQSSMWMLHPSTLCTAVTIK